MIDCTIVDIVKENKELWAAILSIVGSPVVAVLTNKMRKHKEDIEKKKEEADKVSLVAKGLDHPFFRSMDKYIKFDIRNIDISDPLKKEVTIKFLLLMYETFSNLMKSLVASNATIEKFYDAIDVGVREYEAKALDMGIPDLFIKKFSKIHTLVIKSVYENIDNVVNSDALSVKVDVVLHIYKMAFDLTFLWAEDIVDTMNGELHRVLCKRCEKPGAICGKGCTR